MNTHTLPFIKEIGPLTGMAGLENVKNSLPGKTRPSTEAVTQSANRVSRVPYKSAGKSLRTQYKVTLQVGFMLSLLVMVTLFRIPLQVESKFENEVVQQEVVHLEEIVQTEQKFKAPPPPRPIVPIEVPNDEILEEEEFELDVALDLDEMIEELEPPSLPDMSVEPEVDETEIFMVVEEMPQMIGGQAALYEKVEYPAMAREARLEGTVVVGIVISKEGVPQDLQILKSIHPILDDAAKEAIEQIRFTPGKQRGKAVKVKMAIPIRFKLI